jgi:hypothetical protein
LAGIVQALMLTKHMLFVGFSLSDTNFLNIASTVKKALMSRKKYVFKFPIPTCFIFTSLIRIVCRDSTHFGTALQLIQNPLLDELWEGDIRMINMTESIDKPVAQDWAIAARRGEIFLDYCVNRSLSGAATHHIMDPTYSILLNDGERALALSLKQFMEQLPADAKVTPAYRKIATVIDDLGGDVVDKVLQKQLSKAVKNANKKSVKKLAASPMWASIAHQLEQKQSQSSTAPPTTTKPPRITSNPAKKWAKVTTPADLPAVATSSTATSSSSSTTVPVKEQKPAPETPTSPRSEDASSVATDDTLDLSIDEDVEIMIEPIIPFDDSEESSLEDDSDAPSSSSESSSTNAAELAAQSKGKEPAEPEVKQSEKKDRLVLSAPASSSSSSKPTAVAEQPAAAESTSPVVEVKSSEPPSEKAAPPAPAVESTAAPAVPSVSATSVEPEKVAPAESAAPAPAPVAATLPAPTPVPEPKEASKLPASDVSKDAAPPK